MSPPGIISEEHPYSPHGSGRQGAAETHVDLSNCTDHIKPRKLVWSRRNLCFRSMRARAGKFMHKYHLRNASVHGREPTRVGKRMIAHAWERHRADRHKTALAVDVWHPDEPLQWGKHYENPVLEYGSKGKSQLTGSNAMDRRWWANMEAFGYKHAIWIFGLQNFIKWGQSSQIISQFDFVIHAIQTTIDQGQPLNAAEGSAAHWWAGDSAISAQKKRKWSMQLLQIEKDLNLHIQSSQSRYFEANHPWKSLTLFQGKRATVIDLAAFRPVKPEF
jgi:hypothetical protein